MLKDYVKRIPGARRLVQALGLSPDYRRPVLELLPEHSVGLEIGVHRGDFSSEILRVVQPERLHLVDPWKHEQGQDYEHAWYGGEARGGQREMDERYRSVCARFRAQVRAGQVAIHRGFSSDVLDELPDHSLDWVYIDGNHLYEYVKKDLELSLRKTKPGGYVLGDDYTEGAWWEGGVKRAVDECSSLHPFQSVEIRGDQFILRKP